MVEENGNNPSTETELFEKDVGKGLTDDERVSRESDHSDDGARVTPGPEDEKRMPS